MSGKKFRLPVTRYPSPDNRFLVHRLTVHPSPLAR